MEPNSLTDHNLAFNRLFLLTGESAQSVQCGTGWDCVGLCGTVWDCITVWLSGSTHGFPPRQRPVGLSPAPVGRLVAKIWCSKKVPRLLPVGRMVIWGLVTWSSVHHQDHRAVAPPPRHNCQTAIYFLSSVWCLHRRQSVTTVFIESFPRQISFIFRSNFLAN